MLSISLLHLGRVAGWVYQQGLKHKKIKDTEQAKTGANYVILTKWTKLPQEKNPASYLKSMQNVGFEQTSTKFTEIFVG